MPGSSALAQKSTSAVERQIARKIEKAMSDYDLLEYEKAKKGLLNALVLAKQSGLGQKESTALIHMYLAVVYFSGFQDKEAAHLEFVYAVDISASIEIPPIYRTKEMSAMLSSVVAKLPSDRDTDTEVIGPESEPELETSDSDECSDVNSFEHTLLEEAARASAAEIEVLVGKELEATKLTLFFRSESTEYFSEANMERESPCLYIGLIPARAMRGRFVHYYIAAFNRQGEQVGKSGSKGSPNIISITAARRKVRRRVIDNENPFSDPTIENQVTTKSDRGPTFFILLAAGSGAGYITGETEAENVPVQCCLALAPFHIFPEIGFFASEHTSVSAAFRLGFPLGANVPGHAKAGPSGFLRIRRSFSKRGTGFSLSWAIGGGLIRHTVKLASESTGAGKGVDTTVTGPLLVSGGLGYIAPLGGGLRFVAELQATLGVPIVESLGTCPGDSCIEPNFGIHADFNLGLILAF